jgi:hypothetical protein
MYKDLLPIGSVVLLKDADKRLMITGIIQARHGDDKIYDYSACLYPEGTTGSENMYFFDRTNIERVYFLGYQDEEEVAYRENVIDQLGELKIENGQIVPVI